MTKQPHLDWYIREIGLWLDRHQAGLSQHERISFRILKIGEEYGEAVQAWIGVAGQNPRKGFSHSREQLLNELADTAITALVAIEAFNVDPTHVLLTRAGEIEQRIQ